MTDLASMTAAEQFLLTTVARFVNEYDKENFASNKRHIIDELDLKEISFRLSEKMQELNTNEIDMILQATALAPRDVDPRMPDSVPTDYSWRNEDHKGRAADKTIHAHRILCAEVTLTYALSLWIFGQLHSFDRHDQRCVISRFGMPEAYRPGR